MLSVSFLGCAIWVGFDLRDVARGLIRVEMPGRQGVYDPWRVTLAMIGAVGGSLMNLVYPYFLEAKGWRGPEYRRVQLYDFLLGVSAMLVLNLAVWVLGAELLYPDRRIEHLEDLPNLVSNVLGTARTAAVLRGDLLGNLHVDHRTRRRARLARHACVAPNALGRAARRDRLPAASLLSMDRRLVPDSAADLDHARHARVRRADAGRQQRARSSCCPMLAGGLWWITASERLIGRDYRNRWWENAVMALLFALAGYFAVQAIRDLVSR